MRIRTYLLAGLAFVAIAGIFLSDRPVSSVRAAEEGSSHALHGWAWSSNIGWMSFNSSDTDAGGGPYAVSISSTGEFSGFAWSPHVGWIGFDPSYLLQAPPCPGANLAGSTRGKTNLTSGVTSGWARALVGIGRTDGWDGCIELAGTGHPSGISYNGSQGITYHPPAAAGASGFFKGYAWGGSVMGWLSFFPLLASDNPVICPDCGGEEGIDATIGSDFPVVPVGSRPHISWSSTNADMCVGINFETGGEVSGDNVPGEIQESSLTYTVECSNAAGQSATKSVTVGVMAPESSMKLMIDRSATALNSKVPGGDFTNYFGIGFDRLKVKRGDLFTLGWAIDSDEHPNRYYMIVPSNPGPDNSWYSIDMGSPTSSAVLETAGMTQGSYLFILKYSDSGPDGPYANGSLVTLQIGSTIIEEI